MEESERGNLSNHQTMCSKASINKHLQSGTMDNPLSPSLGSDETITPQIHSLILLFSIEL